MGRSRTRVGVLVAALLSVGWRLRFVFTPINSDEGGFLAIARAWRHGSVLYRDVWVDRPQGLLVVYRLFDMITGNEDVVRVIALVFGAVAVVAVAIAVRMVASPAAAVLAAFFAAILSAAPAIEGYTANGELLSSSMSAVAVALAVVAIVRRRSWPWMVAAGAAGALGWSIKQSAVDGLVAIGLWLIVASFVGWLPRRESWVRLAQLVAGAAALVAACAVHAALTEWHGWWYAVIGYRAEQRSAFVGADWKRLGTTAVDAWPVLLPAAIAARVGAVLLRRRGTPTGTGLTAMFVMWMAASVLGFLAGGQFFHHYWVILALPLAALCGVTIGRVDVGKARIVACYLVAFPALWSWSSLVVLSHARVPIAVSNEPRPLQAEVVGHWLRDHTRPGDSVYMMCAAAHAYAHAHADPPYRYLWFDGVRQAEGAQAELERLFTGPDPPTWVAEFDAFRSCNRSGVVKRAVASRYARTATIDGVRIYRLAG